MDDFEIIDGVLVGYHGTDTDIQIPDGVREIRCRFPNARSVYINMGCEVISDKAIGYNYYLGEVTLPPSLKHIEGDPFFDYLDDVETDFIACDDSYAGLWLKAHNYGYGSYWYLFPFQRSLDKDILIYEDNRIKIWVTGFGTYKDYFGIFMRYEIDDDRRSWWYIGDDGVFIINGKPEHSYIRHDFTDNGKCILSFLPLFDEEIPHFTLSFILEIYEEDLPVSLIPVHLTIDPEVSPYIIMEGV